MGTLNSVPGKIDDALEFDGGQNYVEIPALGAWEQVSMECWALQADAASGIQGIVSTWQWAAGKVHFKFESDQIQADKNDGVKVAFDRDLNVWYHIIYTTDTQADEFKLYVNGELVAEVRIYNRVLSEEEVRQNFNVESNTLTAVDSTGKLATTWGKVKAK